MACLSLASKSVDSDHIQPQIILRLGCNDQYTIGQISEKEKGVLKAINITWDFPTIYEFVELIFMDVIVENHTSFKDEDWEILNQIKKICLFYSSMVCYDCSLLKYSYF